MGKSLNVFKIFSSVVTNSRVVEAGIGEYKAINQAKNQYQSDIETVFGSEELRKRGEGFLNSRYVIQFIRTSLHF